MLVGWPCHQVLVGAYVNLAVCCEKYADHLDANPTSAAPAEATAPRRARPTASAMRKKAAKFCQQVRDAPPVARSSAAGADWCVRYTLGSASVRTD